MNRTEPSPFSKTSMLGVSAEFADSTLLYKLRSLFCKLIFEETGGTSFGRFAISSKEFSMKGKELGRLEDWVLASLGVVVPAVMSIKRDMEMCVCGGGGSA